MTPSVFEIVLLLAAVLCSLVAGFLFAFAVVVMPGIASLDDAAFLRAFQAIDRIIQNGQPLFVLVWVGSVLSAVAAAALGLWTLSGAARALIVIAALAYLIGVQGPTAAVHIPLNNWIQKLDVVTMTDEARRDTRDTFERRWNRWNAVRTAAAGVVVVLWLVALLTL